MCLDYGRLGYDYFNRAMKIGWPERSWSLSLSSGTSTIESIARFH